MTHSTSAQKKTGGQQEGEQGQVQHVLCDSEWSGLDMDLTWTCPELDNQTRLYQPGNTILGFPAFLQSIEEVCYLDPYIL